MSASAPAVSGVANRKAQLQEFLSRIQADPRDSQAYAGLASTIDPDLSVQFPDGTSMSYKGLLEKALATIE